jgi:hypothetical protein
MVVDRTMAAVRIAVDHMEAAVRPARLTVAADLTTAVAPTAVAKQLQQEAIKFKQGLTKLVSPLF